MRQTHFNKEQKRRRRDRFCWVDYYVIENKNLSSSAKITYLILARFANNETQECHPSITTIAKLAGLHPDTVRVAVRDLQRARLIEIDDTAKGEVFYYQLNNTPRKNQPPEKKGKTPRKEGEGLPENKGTNKTNMDKTNINKTNNIKTSKEVTRKDQEIFDLINKFQEVNPSYKRLFSNKTQREALQRLIDNFGKEKIEKLINTIAITNQMKFAPIITTPLELESKLGRLLSFIKQQQQSDKGKEFITTF